MSFDVWLLTERHELSRNKLDYAMLQSDADMLTRNEVHYRAERSVELVFIVVWCIHYIYLDRLPVIRPPANPIKCMGYVMIYKIIC